MSGSSRRKGIAGEREVAAIFTAAGLTVRGLEGSGDHLVMVNGNYDVLQFTLHSEVKRQESPRPGSWIAQAEAECPPGCIPVVSWRRNGSRWWSMIPTEQLAEILAQ